MFGGLEVRGSPGPGGRSGVAGWWWRRRWRRWRGCMCGCLGGKRLAAPPHHAALLPPLLGAFTRGNVLLLPQPPLGEWG